jgi:hypothetical protein
MIYKFIDETKIDASIEFELIDDRLNIFSIDNKKDENVSISIEKKDVYYLIGALHLLHKEMK